MALLVREIDQGRVNPRFSESLEKRSFYGVGPIFKLGFEILARPNSKWQVDESLQKDQLFQSHPSFGRGKPIPRAAERRDYSKADNSHNQAANSVEKVIPIWRPQSFTLTQEGFGNVPKLSEQERKRRVTNKKFKPR